MEEDSSQVTTRFAPSPTGLLHIGGARTALFNFMWARRNGGRFLLRFEDTDPSRSRVEYEESIALDLRWLGIVPDCAPERQSLSAGRHAQVLSELRRIGAVYPCFCKGPDSDGDAAGRQCSCGRLTSKEAEAMIHSGEPHCWRFRAPGGGSPLSFRDRLRGTIGVPAKSVADFVVTRSDGSSTYLLAAVIDDHDSSVTHVIRGDEHLSNTPRQEMIYRALGWTPPQWVHIPMILDSDRRKLGKRSGAVSIGSYRDEGWMPEAVASYLATLSWSGAPADELRSPIELSRTFDLDSVATTPPIHDPDRMRHFGQLSVAGMTAGQILEKYEHIFPELAATAGDGLSADRVSLAKELAPSCATTMELGRALAGAFEIPAGALPASGALWTSDLINRLGCVLGGEWRSDGIGRALKDFQRERGLKGRELYHTLRLLVTGRESGAPIALILSCLGRERVMERLAERSQDR